MRAGNRTLAWLGIGVGMLLVPGVISAVVLRMVAHSEVPENRAREVVTHGSQLLLELTAVDTGKRGYLLTGNVECLGGYHSALVGLQQDAEVLLGLTAEQPGEQEEAGELREAIGAKLGELAAAMSTHDWNAPTPASAIERDRTATERVRAAVRRLQEDERALLDSFGRERRWKLRFAFLATVGGACFAIMALLVCYWLLRRGLRYRTPAAPQRQRSMESGALAAAHETERKGVSRELNESLTQTLAILALDLGKLAATPPPQPAAWSDHLRSFQRRIVLLGEEVSRISHRLRSPIVEELDPPMGRQAFSEAFAEREGIGAFEGRSRRRLPPRGRRNRWMRPLS